MTELAQQTIAQDKNQEAFRIANELFRQNPDWVTFFREILGVDGVVRRLFPDQRNLSAFEQTDEYNEIQQMLARLRQRRDGQADNQEPTRVITVRLPHSLHQSLQREASERNTSMNKLCISKLLHVIGDDLLPGEQTSAATEHTGTTEQPSFTEPTTSNAAVFTP